MPLSGLIASYAAHEATRSRSLAEFWDAIAGTSGQSSSDFAQSATAAADDLETAMTTAELQFQARYSALLLLGCDAYEPSILPSHFSADVTHPLLPLVPGQTLIYEGQIQEGLERHEVTVMEETRTIAGVDCREVRTLETIDGELREIVTDWYAQDLQGNVWCFGHSAQHLNDGFIDGMEGSWRAGHRQAKPGIVMPHEPYAGQVFRQELAVNVAESLGKVVVVDMVATLAIGSYTGCIEIEDKSILEPEELENRIYAPAVGLVRETDGVTGQSLDLIQVTSN